MSDRPINQPGSFEATQLLAEMRKAAAQLADRPPFLCSVHIAANLRLPVLRHPDITQRRMAMQMPPPLDPNPFWGVPIYVDPGLPPGEWYALDQHGNTLAAGVVVDADLWPGADSQPGTGTTEKGSPE